MCIRCVVEFWCEVLMCSHFQRKLKGIYPFAVSVTIYADCKMYLIVLASNNILE